jgi:hypothetical protein
MPAPGATIQLYTTLEISFTTADRETDSSGQNCSMEVEKGKWSNGMTFPSHTDELMIREHGKGSRFDSSLHQ